MSHFKINKVITVSTTRLVFISFQYFRTGKHVSFIQNKYKKNLNSFWHERPSPKVPKSQSLKDTDFKIMLRIPQNHYHGFPT